MRHCAIAISLLVMLAAAGRAQVWERSRSVESIPTANGRLVDRTLAGETSEIPIAGGSARLLPVGIPAERAAAIAAQVDDRIARAQRLAPLRLESGPIRLVVAVERPGPSTSRVTPGISARRFPNLADAEVEFSGLSASDVGAEIARDLVELALGEQAPAAPVEVTGATARALVLSLPLTDDAREELALAGAEPENSLEQPGREILAALWIREMSLESPGLLAAAWPPAAGTGGLRGIAAIFASRGGEPGRALRRALERAFTAVEVPADLAHISGEDAFSGAIDASSPGVLAWRFYCLVPEPGRAASVVWPGASSGFAVVRYEDSLPPDVVEFSPGEHRILPAAGVRRIDWIVDGGQVAPATASPVALSPELDFPAAGLVARGDALGGGIRLEWTTASHHALSGWAILRTESTGDGQVRRSAPGWLPAQEEDPLGARFVYLDRGTVPGRYYLYDVWAVTTDGALSRGFSVTVAAR
jgi:hypothetical protein